MSGLRRRRNIVFVAQHAQFPAQPGDCGPERSSVQVTVVLMRTLGVPSGAHQLTNSTRELEKAAAVAGPL
jgi:hypothetical protein